MHNNNTWYKDQPRNKGHAFLPMWSKNTILDIITRLGEGITRSEIEAFLVKEYDIRFDTAWRWIKLAKRIKVNIDSGLSTDDAFKKDQEFRNAKKRK